MDAVEIKNIRKKLGLTQVEFAKKIGVSRDTVINYERGDKIPDSKIEMLNNLLFETKDKDFGFREAKHRNSEFIEKNISSSKQQDTSVSPTGYYYPNVSAAAGMDKDILNDELKRIPINIPNWEKEVDFINVYGDSMYPKYCSGEIIGIKEVEPQYINYGYAYVVILNDGQVFLKYIKKGKDDEHWLLASENPRYEPKEYHLSLIKKVYIIKGVITKTTM